MGTFENFKNRAENGVLEEMRNNTSKPGSFEWLAEEEQDRKVKNMMFMQYIN